MASEKTKQKILSTFLGLIAAKSYGDVSLIDVAEEASVKLAEMRAVFPTKMSLVEAFAEKIDKSVLNDRDESMSDQPARDRLFDVLMTRIDALSEHKEAVRAMREAAKQDPVLLLEFSNVSAQSQKWMLIASGIEFNDMKATLVARGLSVAFARVVDVWLMEADEGMPRTMACLDKELDKGSDMLKRVGQVERVASSFGSIFTRLSKMRASHSKNDNKPSDMQDVS